MKRAVVAVVPISNLQTKIWLKQECFGFEQKLQYAWRYVQFKDNCDVIGYYIFFAFKNLNPPFKKLELIN